MIGHRIHAEEDWNRARRSSRHEATAVQRTGRLRFFGKAIKSELGGARKSLFKTDRPRYVRLAVDKAAINSAIYEHPEFAAFITSRNDHFGPWRQKSVKTLRKLQSGCHPKQVITALCGVLHDVAEVERIFLIVKAQKEY
jgi:hypothetical protein